MPTLLLLNGPPASGKSTLAARLVDARPLSLNLDVDVVRSQLGDWLDQPRAAGLAARSLALAMARTHLLDGRDVVVPQLLARTTFIEDLERVAHEVRASFVEVMLELDRADAIDAFETRRADSDSRVHRDAAALVDRSDEVDPVGDMYDALQRIPELRPATRRLRVLRGDIEATVDALLRALPEFTGLTS